MKTKMKTKMNFRIHFILIFIFVFILFLLSKSFCIFVNSTWPRGAMMP